MDRPALKKLLDDVRARRVDVIVVYKVDRLTRSLADFAKLVELFDAHQVSFVSVTQSMQRCSQLESSSSGWGPATTGQWPDRRSR
jgi:site-specific DNA recombinase